MTAAELAKLSAMLPPTVKQIEAARELCEMLPGLMRKASDAGLPLTATALQEAVQHVGWEHAAQMKRILP